MELFVILIFLTVTIAGTQESQLEGPQNTLSFVGSTVTLKCSSTYRNCSGIDWQIHKPGASPATVFKGPATILSGVDRHRYSVDNSSGCDLVIRNVQLTDAGRFICSAIISSSQETKTAYLIILETQPNCTINASMDDTVEGDRVQLNCIVTYNTAKEATIAWKTGTDSPAAVENGAQRSCTITALQSNRKKRREASLNSNSSTVAYNGTNRASTNVSQTVTVKTTLDQLTSVVTLHETSKTTMHSTVLTDSSSVVKKLKPECESYFVVASAPEIPPFTCIASFAFESTFQGVEIAGLAKNIPNATCDTPVVKVVYSARNVTLFPSLPRYSPGRVINCTANGHPSPTFKWQKMKMENVIKPTWIDIQNGSELIMTNVSSKWYRCVAMNVVRFKSYNDTSHEFLINNTESVHGVANETDLNVTDYSTSTQYVPSDSTAPAIIYPLTHLPMMAAGACVLLLIILLIVVCFCNKACPGYKCCNSGNKSKDELRDEQPLTENPDVCIYSVVNKGQDSHQKTKSPKRPKGTPTQPTAGHNDAYQHEEVTYADLAMEYGPRKVVRQNGQAAQEESVYAAVSAA